MINSKQPTTQYRLHRIQGKQIVLRSVHGALRVVNTTDVKVGITTADGIRLLSSTADYTIAVEDFDKIKSLLN